MGKDVRDDGFEINPLPSQIYDENGDTFYRIIDPVSGALIYIPSDHYKIHEGVGFQYELYYDTPIVTGTNTYTIGFTVQEGRYTHLKDIVLTSFGNSDFKATLYGESETGGITISENTAGEFANLNHNAPAIPNVGVYEATITDLSKCTAYPPLINLHNETNKGQSSEQYAMSDYIELVLKTNTKYAIKFESITAGNETDKFKLRAFFYSETAALI